MRLTLAAAAVLSTLSLQQAVAGTVNCAPITEQQVAELFDRWNASLRTLDSEKVAANYAENAILLPTLSNTPRLTHEQRAAYFDHFLKKRPQGSIDLRVIRVGCNMATDSGIYTFSFADGTKIPARYTYTYEFMDGKWMITAHHSSAMPET
ncbi:SgcJ/EcaC family oxidoreductase (plasmid) [Rhizobium sp. CB3171]|uniref:SgcJ/EcaC family oxidoreductase n=1 Tax=Rhizobium sp. CB3171 TaxID=3039157 RepID=UPI0024B1CFF4|nr:SgcJ/EcaC family oxidoreductase [Rhizobium sp. CB3171]WFU06998.1 SgcJ/EcaC family oxidoreductase [Rhizobium sp. CB3171]